MQVREQLGSTIRSRVFDNCSKRLTLKQALKIVDRMSDKEGIDQLVKDYHELKNEIHKVIVGQDEVVDQVLISIFSRGHCLLVGVPGLAKTLLVSKAVKGSFSRIQFTPDLMPSDIIGSEVLDEGRNFKFIKGPLFTNIVLADEINRAPAKTTVRHA